MIKKTNNTLVFDQMPQVTSFSAIVGKKEKCGPLGDFFETWEKDPYFGQKTWEEAESEMIKKCVNKTIQKAMITDDSIDFVIAGDLLNQCVGSTFGLMHSSCPHIGIYGACSTMALATCLGAVFVASGAANKTICATSSHFSTAERQFRQPLEYGGQRCPTAQWTVTGSGTILIENGNQKPSAGKTIKIKSVTFGKIEDYGVTDVNNMGAAMAPAAASTIKAFLHNTASSPCDYDAIVTGDLGTVGSDLLNKLLQKESIDISKVHYDCGCMIYDLKSQDVHAGGSGCGCSASVLCGYFLPKLERSELGSILFVATGALMSPITVQQGKTIPSIAHLINFIN